MQADDQTTETQKTPSEDQEAAAKWLREIDAAEKGMSGYNERCDKIQDIYTADKEKSGNAKKFAILWSNVQVLQPAVYSRTPEPVVKRRYNDQDPLARVTSDIVERALEFNFDKTDFDGTMKHVRDNFILFARGGGWVRYEPTIQKMGDGDTAFEQVVDERVVADFVHRKDLIYPQQRTWKELPWLARRVFMSRDEGIRRFGEEKGKALQLDHKPDNASDDGQKETVRKAVIYEIWSKVDQECFWVSRGCRELLDRSPPLLDLEGFFPCPMPAFGTVGDKLIPTPDYIYYQDQADEINRLTARIDALTDQLKLVGFYPAGSSENEAVIETAIRGTTENVIIGVPSWAAFSDKGGVAQIQWLPIDQVAKIITACVTLRKQLVEDIYQITGISDVVRGESDPRETAAAQGIKAQWGSIRIRDRQTELARFARDMTRIMGEVIADKFQPETLAAMTGIQLPTREQVAQQFQIAMAQWQQVAQQAMTAGQPAPPQPQPPQVLTQDDVIDLLRNDRMRSFRIDIETDSTVEADQNEQKQRMTEYVTAFGEFVTKVMPAGQQAPELIPVFGEILTQSARVFRVSRTLETTIDAAMQKLQQRAANPQPPQPNPTEQVKLDAAKVKAGAEVNKAQAENVRTAMELQGDRELRQHESRQMIADTLQAAVQPPPQPQVIQ